MGFFVYELERKKIVDEPIRQPGCHGGDKWPRPRRTANIRNSLFMGKYTVVVQNAIMDGTLNASRT